MDPTFEERAQKAAVPCPPEPPYVPFPLGVATRGESVRGVFLSGAGHFNFSSNSEIMQSASPP